MSVSRRAVLTGAIGAGALSACSPAQQASAPTSGTTATSRAASGAPSPSPTGQILGHELGAVIGDGSTSEHKEQPGQLAATRIAPGEEPPQLVVVSWDGAAALASDQLTRFREVAKRNKAHMTLFLSGMYCVPEGKRMTYQPPAGHKPGSSAISFLTEQSVHRTIQGIGQAWVEGHEIGTHFNGHWCGPTGVGSWSSQDWKQEIDEAVRFVTSWKTITGFTDLPPFPFDYRKELVGSRTPCLEGRKAMLPVAKQLGWRYDTSATSTQTWQRRMPNGMWDLSMPSVPFRGRQALAMDYNFMYQQSHADPKGDKSMYAQWQAEVTDGLKRGLERAVEGNRAPMVVGNHFEQWNGGIYMNAVEEFMDHCGKDERVRLVSFRELCDYLEAQDPAVLAKLQRLGVGEKPKGGWAEYLGAPAPKGTATPSAPAGPSATASATPSA